MATIEPVFPPKAATGIAGLDDILYGGVVQHRLYLIQGEPGTGKTTVGLQFLLEGVKAGEKVLFVTLSQTEQDLRQVARSHGWSLTGVSVCELTFPPGNELSASDQTVFHSAEVELGETINTILKAVEEAEPARVVFDSMLEVRFLAGSPRRYRQKILALRNSLARHRCTTLLLCGDPLRDGDEELPDLVHGLVKLERDSPHYGNARRRLEVVKMRGMDYQGGYHNFRIRTGGLEVYPRLAVAAAATRGGREVVESGVAELDQLLGGGMEAGTAALITGSAAGRGQHAAIFLFDERAETFHQRCQGLGMDIRPYLEEGLVKLWQIDAGELSSSEFAHLVRQAVEEGQARVVVLDSLTGYLNAMLQGRLLIVQLHELLSYLSQREVLSLLMVAQETGSGMIMPIDVGYLSDTVLLLRHVEMEGGIRKAISVLKKRYGSHENTFRELRMSSSGIHIGEPLTAFSGTPTFSRQALDHDAGKLENEG